MRKWIAVIAALAVLALGAGPGRAEGTDLSGYSVASGNVAAVGFEDLTAPWSGTLLPFDWAAGDAVEAGQEMFTLRTETVYAPENGTVKTVFAAPGESAAAVSLRYGAALFLEGEHPDRIQATTATAFQKRENKIIQMGETLYFRSDKAGREEGSGRVIQVSGGGYLVEILEGSFEMGENLSLFRKEDYSANAKVGMGQVSRRDPVPVTGQGRIREILVAAGERVTEGQPVMTLMGLDAEPGAAPEIRAGQAGVVAQVMAVPGQQVWKGALLARIWHTDQLEVVAEVDEMDLKALHIGSQCPVILDMDPDTRLTGTVTEIGALGVKRQNAAYYPVHFRLERNDLPLGASASVYLTKR